MGCSEVSDCMKGISRVITREMFLNSYRILYKYISDKRHALQDINFVLISDFLLSLEEGYIVDFYKKNVETGIIYAAPELYISDPVTIPKGIADLREYRFFSTYGSILYNSMGIFFAEVCSKMITDLRLEQREIYSFVPTSFFLSESGWVVNERWQEEYGNFKRIVEEKTEISDVVLSIDISNFFGSIKHEKLIEVLKRFLSAQNKAKYSFNEESEIVLKNYLSSVMGGDKGLPQGKKNFASDYLSFLYLTLFDLEIQNLSSSQELGMISMARYVDDIYIFFKKNEDSLEPQNIYKELVRIEHSISKWLFENLRLTINDTKTKRFIITEPADKKKFISKIHKRTSGLDDALIDRKNDYEKIQSIIQAIRTFTYPTSLEFSEGVLDNKSRENLKYIFEDRIRHKLSKEYFREVFAALSSASLELSASHFSILSRLFSTSDGKNKVFLTPLISYFTSNFDPSDKRHIEIALFTMANSFGDEDFISFLAQYNGELLFDNYGKYLVAYNNPEFCISSFKKEKFIFSSDVYMRICLERNFSFKKSKIKDFLNHPFIDLLSESEDSTLESIYTAICGYTNDCMYGRWSVALNRLQIVMHETLKRYFDVTDNDKIDKILEKVRRRGALISIDEEIDIIKLWEHRNFNPISHGSKNGIVAPEIEKNELITWEFKVNSLIKKILIGVR